MANLENDPLHQNLLQFTDKALEWLAQQDGDIRVLTKKMDELQGRVESVLKGHEGNQRDDLKDRLDNYEKKLHILMEEYRAKQHEQK